MLFRGGVFLSYTLCRIADPMVGNRAQRRVKKRGGIMDSVKVECRESI